MTIDIRTLTGLSGRKLQELTGLHWSLFSHIARGERALTVETALKVSKATKIGLKELLPKEQIKALGLKN